MRRYAIVLLIVLAGLLPGCNEWAIIRPTTELTVNPVWKTVTFKNTKDVDSKLKNFHMGYASTQPADGPAISSAWVDIESWDVLDSASSVIKENVAQMAVAVEQMKQTNEMIKSTFSGLTDLASSIVPGVVQINQAIQAAKTANAQAQAIDWKPLVEAAQAIKAAASRPTQ